MSRAKGPRKPDVPTGDRFTCKRCRHKYNTATEHAGDRVCVTCAAKPGEAIPTPPPPVAEIPDMDMAVPTAVVAAAVSVTSVLTQAKQPPQPLTPYDDASLLAEIESPQFNLDFFVRERVRAKHDQDLAKLQIEDCNKHLLPFFQRNHIRGVDFDGYKVMVMRHGQSTIDKALLLQNGVSAEVIEKCTKRSSGFTIQVKGPKEEKPESGAGVEEGEA